MFEQLSATGDIRTDAGVPIRCLVLSAAGAAASAEIRRGGSTGVVVLTLTTPANTSVVLPVCFVIDKPHATITGAGAKLSIAL